MFAYLPNLDILNAVVTNLGIIVGAILTFYFTTLYLTTNSKRTHLSFVTADFLSQSSLPITFFLGVVLGFLSFILSLNNIPIFNTSSSVDMRYVFIFFSVVYGSNFLGTITTTTLVILKSLYYYFSPGPVPPTDFFNNIVLSFILLFLAILLNQQPIKLIMKNVLFISIFLLVRYIFFFFYFAPFFQLQKQLHFLAYAVIFTLIFSVASFIIETALSISRSVHIYRTAAIYDNLTNVYNKESFNFFLDYAANLSQQGAKELSLAVLDIDNFKEVNDKFGHPVGDFALRFLSEQMLALKKEQKHFVCRIGGDEFAIIHQEEPVAAEHYYQELLKRLDSNEFHFKDISYKLELSIGLTHFSLNEDFSPQSALEEADKALYKAKALGKNQLVITYGKHNQKELEGS